MLDVFQRISETEMEVMEVIWELHHPVTSAELLIFFSEQRGKDWKTQTISTFLARLVDKGLLVVRKQGRSNVYTAHLSLVEYRKRESQSILNKMYQGSIKNFLSALYDNEEISKEDISELKQWFSER